MSKDIVNASESKNNPIKLFTTGLFRAGIVLVFMGMGLYFQAKKGMDSQFYSILAVTIISASIAGFNVIYDYDVWSVKKKIIVHTICMAITVLPALYISGWYDTTSIHGLFAILASFVIFGLVAVTIGYLVSKFILKNVTVNK